MSTAFAPPGFGPGRFFVSDADALALLQVIDRGLPGAEQWRVELTAGWMFASTPLDDGSIGVVAVSPQAQALHSDDFRWRALYRENKFSLMCHAYTLERGAA